MKTMQPSFVQDSASLCFFLLLLACLSFSQCLPFLTFCTVLPDTCYLPSAVAISELYIH